MRRSRADWMVPADDAILEFLADEEGATPALLASELDYARNYLVTRCTELTSYGLAERPTRGLYRISDEGRSYLSGGLDASTLHRQDGDDS